MSKDFRGTLFVGSANLEQKTCDHKTFSDLFILKSAFVNLFIKPATYIHCWRLRYSILGLLL